MTTVAGTQAIDTLHVGQKGLAYNSTTHKMELEPVLHVWINHDLVDLTLTTLVKGTHGHPATQKSEVLHTNERHPFLTVEKGFLPVSQLRLGMHIVRANGSIGVVTRERVVPGVQVMYNLEVAQDHTYTVGDGQWVVHNCGSTTSLPDLLSQAASKSAKGELTAAGRAFQKHASRPAGEAIWGIIKGNAKVLNQLGQDIVDDIITHPETSWKSGVRGRYGPVLDGILPDGRGARWGLDPTDEFRFIGFLNP